MIRGSALEILKPVGGRTLQTLLISCFDILQGALQLGVAACGGEEILIEVNLYVGLNAHALITFFVY